MIIRALATTAAACLSLTGCQRDAEDARPNVLKLRDAQILIKTNIDGFTDAGDMDKDGKRDVIISTKAGYSLWTSRTKRLTRIPGLLTRAASHRAPSLNEISKPSWEGDLLVFPRAGLLFGGRDAHWLPARKTWPQAAKLQTVSLRESFTTGTLSPTEGLLWEVVGLSRRVSVVDGRPRLRLASIPKLEGPYYLAHNGRIFQSLFTDVRELIDNRWEPVARYSKETSPDFSVPVGDSIIVIASRAHDEPGDFPDTEDTVVDLIGPDDDVDRNDPWRRIDAYGTSASVNPDNAVTLTGEQGQAYVVRINHGELQIGRLENAQGILTLPENQAIVLGRDRKLRIGRLEWTAPWADNPPGTL